MELMAGAGREGPQHAPLRGREVGTHACICLRAEGPGRSRRSLPHSAHSGRLSCCAGNAGSGRTGGHSCPRRWGLCSHCTGTAGRAGEPQRAPKGPQNSRHHRSHSAALGKGRGGVWRRGPEGGGCWVPTEQGEGGREPKQVAPASPCGTERGLLGPGPSSAISWLCGLEQAPGPL